MRSITIDHQKKIADQVLAKIEKIDPTCILAGGAPRDWTLGRLASDLDVYFYWRPDLQLHHLEKLLKDMKLPSHQRKHRGVLERNEYLLNPSLMTVYEGFVGGMKVQLMRMCKPTFKSVVPEFALDICKAWYKNGIIQTTKEFDEAVAHKIIRVTNNLYADESAYVQKIRNKFPDFVFVGRRI